MNKKRIKTIIAAFCVTSILSTTYFTKNSYAAIDRFWGQSRVDTALEIANEGWKNKLDYAIIAGAEDNLLIDALMAVPLGKAYNAPILLNTKGEQVNLKNMKFLKEKGIKEVFVVSGENVFPKIFEKQLQDQKIKVTRLGGEEKSKTSLNIANALKSKVGKIQKAFVVSSNSKNIVDALSIAPIAASTGAPILVSNKDAMDENLKKFVKNDTNIVDTYFIGGDQAISNNVMVSLNGKRVSGRSRYDTNIAILNTFKNVFKGEKYFISSANNANIVDSITGSLFAANSSAPVILVGNTLEETTKNYMRTNFDEKKYVAIFGGENAVKKETAEAIENIKNGEEDGISKLTSVDTISSNIIKVKLKYDKPITKDNFLVKENGRTVKIDSIWKDSKDISNTTYFVKLSEYTTSSKIYTINREKFNGIDRDLKKPEIVSIDSIDFNKVAMKFSEDINISELKLVLRDKSSGKELKISNYDYVENCKDKVKITTEEQVNGKIYEVVAYGAKDLEDNYMVKLNDGWVKGIGKDLKTKLSVKEAIPLSYKEIMVLFNKPVPEDKLFNKNNFVITDGRTQSRINVKSISKPSDEDLNSYGEGTLYNSVVLNLEEGMGDAKGYIINFKNLETTSGVGMDETSTTKLIGVGPYATRMDFTDEGYSIITLNKNRVRVFFKRRMDPSTMVANNFSIEPLFGGEEVQVKGVSVVNNKTVDLMTSDISNGEYRLKVDSLLDKEGNAFELGKNVKAFKGIDESMRIKSIDKVEVLKDNSSIIVTFDSYALEEALNKKNYYINDIGEPLKVEMVSGDPKAVKLTLPKSIEQRKYNLTVKNFADITTSFLGGGILNENITIQSVEPIDKKTLKIVFDRSAKDKSIYGQGKAWFEGRVLNDGFNLNGSVKHNIINFYHYCYVNDENPNELIVRFKDDFFTADKSGYGKFTLSIKGVNGMSEFKYTNNQFLNISINDVEKLSTNKIKVTFNQKVKIENMDNLFKVATSEEELKSLKVNFDTISSLKVVSANYDKINKNSYTFILSGNLGEKNYLVVNPKISYNSTQYIHEYCGEEGNYGFFSIEDEDGSAYGIQHIREFK